MCSGRSHLLQCSLLADKRENALDNICHVWSLLLIIALVDRIYSGDSDLGKMLQQGTHRLHRLCHQRSTVPAVHALCRQPHHGRLCAQLCLKQGLYPSLRDNPSRLLSLLLGEGLCPHETAFHRLQLQETDVKLPWLKTQQANFSNACWKLHRMGAEVSCSGKLPGTDRSSIKP